MPELPLPTIDQGRCTGCGFCLDACPPQVLRQQNGKAYLHNADGCTYCTACEDICPEDAIALPFLIVLAPGQSAKLKIAAADSRKKNDQGN